MWPTAETVQPAEVPRLTIALVAVLISLWLVRDAAQDLREARAARRNGLRGFLARRGVQAELLRFGIQGAVLIWTGTSLWLPASAITAPVSAPGAVALFMSTLVPLLLTGASLLAWHTRVEVRRHPPRDEAGRRWEDR